MEDANYGSPNTHRVEDEIQARLLSDTKAFSYFIPFLAQTRTVSEAAQEIGCNLDTMLYRVKRFLEAELLEVVWVEKRAGRPIKHYRSVHDAYFVPLSLTPFATFEEEVRQLVRRYENTIIRELARSSRTLNRQGKRIYRDKFSEVATHTAKDEEEIFAFDSLPELALDSTFNHTLVAELFSDELLLTQSEAKELLAQLYRLWRDHKLEPTAARKPYVLQVALVPLEPT